MKKIVIRVALIVVVIVLVGVAYKLGAQIGIKEA